MAKSKIRNNKAVQTVALAIALPNLAFAATDDVVSLPTLDVQAEGSTSPYLQKEASSTKRTESLLNTAKTTQIITAESLKQQNLLSLQDALATTPGITFGAGEGGGGYGDKINLRGYDASYNTTIDGLRDPALYTRSDLFNYEAVEITKGANSAENGAGQVSGGVNLVSKKPKNVDANEINVGVGTDDYTRFTGDFNTVVNDSVAARLNVMGHKNQYPGGPEEAKRWGIAPSITFGINDATKTTFSYFHQEDDNDPMYGIPNYMGKFISGISTSNRYGYRNLDNQKITADIATINIESQINDKLKLNSITRYSDIDQETTISAPQGTYCLSSGLTAAGVSCTTPGQYVVSGPRGSYRDTETKQWTNDTNLVSQFNTGLIEHALVTGIGFTQEDYTLTSGGYLYDSNGNALSKPNMDVYNPDNYWHGATNFRKTGVTDGTLNIYSAYVLDTMKFGPQWLFNLGVRYDHTDAKYKSFSYSTTTGAEVLANRTTSDQKDNLVSYNAGLTFKPTENSSLYIAYSNAQKPTSYAASATCATGTTCDVDPEEAVNYEVGAKWQANPDILLSAAIFRNEQNKVRVSDPSNTTTYALDGKNHVDGVELGAVGKILPQWDISASVAYMKGEYDQSIADSVNDADYKEGTEMTNIPKVSGSLWTTYALNPAWKIGYGLTYQGKTYLSDVSATSTVRGESDDYLLHNASVTYTYNQDLSFNLIGKNLSNEKYFTNIRNSGWSTVGAERSAVFNINYKF
ncbi:TonB-dependent receptor [Acinetobacter populi]|uniref:TonB-dependent siderophore receptor n=1 Tax=Acinetobacter populi TaxID=1582270 RepID=A0A1Z9YTQ9_9GAMM|nr:TonB-dependent siderophore receptor [Acinetobacter populi]OUY05588.1 TonB-dependent siderophore receptor [Acinetobacter populi]